MKLLSMMMQLAICAGAQNKFSGVGPSSDVALVPLSEVQRIVNNVAVNGDVDLIRLTHELTARVELLRSARSKMIAEMMAENTGGAISQRFGVVHEAVQVLALIPARSGSKSVPHKNIRLLGGQPMISHTIRHAKQASLVDRVVVSTDSDLYREIAIQHGAEAPFLRPASMAQDASPDLPAFRHALEWLSANENYTPDIVVHLRPTCPVRSIADIDKAIAILANDTSIDAVRSVSPSKENPWRMWWAAPDSSGSNVSSDGVMMNPVALPPGNEFYSHYSIGLAGNSPRQLTPVTYSQNSCIDVARASVIMHPDGGSMTGDRVHGLITESDFDIDTEADFAAALKHISGN